MNEQLASGIKLLERLHEFGHKAFFVGGFVRDYLLGIKTDDIDITTDATPEQVTGIFPAAKPTGLKYGTVTVAQDGFTYEVTTFRSEGRYLNHRHPETITFAQTLEDDLKRRDFTINAMAMAADMTIIDLFSGRIDLKERIIRAIGDPKERFREDALRILRAYRFVSKLDFAIDPETKIALVESAKLLRKIASERIIGEIRKIINYPYAHKAFRDMHENNIAAGLPDLQKILEFLHDGEEITLNEWEFYALAFHLAKLEEIPDSWRFSNKQKDIICKIMMLVEVTKNDRFNEMILYAYGLEACLAANRVNKTLDPQNDQEDLIRAIWAKLPIKRTCDLKYKGQDILSTTDLKDARIIGDIIDKVVFQIITGKLENEYTAIQAFVADILDNQMEQG